MDIIFDIGMYDASDTVYYMEEGYKVIAVEANPNLVLRAKENLGLFTKTGQLHLVNAAIGRKEEIIDFHVSGDDLGSSSIILEKVKDKNPICSYSVSTIDINELFDLYGIPHYMKVDIEGSDRFCVLALTRKTRPRFLSFEIGDDVEELVSHAQEIGYKNFKVINQCNFLELSNQSRLYDRVAQRFIGLLGFAAPAKVRRAGRFFPVEHSSGPVPWKSDGNWSSAQTVFEKLNVAKQSGDIRGWYDMHVS